MKTLLTIFFALISSNAVANNYTDEVNKFFNLFEKGVRRKISTLPD